MLKLIRKFWELGGAWGSGAAAQAGSYDTANEGTGAAGSKDLRRNEPGGH